MVISSATFVFIVAICCIWLLQKLNLNIKRRLYIRKHDCQPAPSASSSSSPLSSWLPWTQQKAPSMPVGAWMQQQFDKNGLTFTSTSAGITKLWTLDPRNLQAVFSTDFAHWGVQPLREFAFGPFAGKGIMTSDGKFWEHSRSLIRPTFARTQIANLRSFDEHVERLLARIPADGSEVDLRPLFSLLALDTSTEVLFGESTGCLASTTSLDAAAFLSSYKYGQACIGRRTQLSLRFDFLFRDAKFWRSCATTREFVERYVDIALASTPAAHGMSKSEGSNQHSEQEHSKQEPSKPSSSSSTSRLVLAQKIAEEIRDRSEIVNQLLNIFLPAHDATGVALTNTFFCLARHPEVYARVRAEVLAVSGAAGPITFAHIKDLHYMRSVLQETLRLHPPIGQMNRVALRDTHLPYGGGADGTRPVFAPRGTVLSTSFYALHRRRDLFGDDAHLFRPERWADSAKRAAPSWSYLPFGGGPRTCVGQQMALTETSYALAKIVRRFERIENADPVREYVEDWKLTTESRNGARVRLVPSGS